MFIFQYTYLTSYSIRRSCCYRSLITPVQAYIQIFKGNYITAIHPHADKRSVIAIRHPDHLCRFIHHDLFHPVCACLCHPEPSFRCINRLMRHTGNHAGKHGTCSEHVFSCNQNSPDSCVYLVWRHLCLSPNLADHEAIRAVHDLLFRCQMYLRMYDWSLHVSLTRLRNHQNHRRHRHHQNPDLRIHPHHHLLRLPEPAVAVAQALAVIAA